MAISTIQVRRGKREDFKPGEMLPGEWAVSIDNDTENQMVWMCFAPGVVKRMGTYEDFVAQVAEATADVRDEYKAEFDAIKKQVDAAAETVQENTTTVVEVKNSIVNTYLPQIEAYVTRAETGATSAEKSATDAEKWAKQAESFTHGGTGVRGNEATDNAQYYLEQTRNAANSITGALKPKGNIKFEQLADLEPAMGDYYNVTDAFQSDNRFADGAGIDYPAGTDIYYTDEDKWNAVQGAGVAGVKGNNESAYRKGLVDITPDNIGLGKVNNTADSEKTVAQAGKVEHALSIGKKTYNGSADVTVEKDDVTTALGYTPVGGQGVNLLTGTKDFSGDNWVNRQYWTVETEKYNGLTVLSKGYHWQGLQQAFPVKAGETYTFSLYAKADTPVECKIYRIGTAPTASVEGNAAEIYTLTTDWKQYIVHIKVTKDGNLNCRIEKDENTENKIYICGYKLEPGTVTDPVWTPAPEDLLLKGEVDGRNLFVMGNSESGYIEVGQPGGVNHKAVNGERTSEFIPVSEGDVFTLQSWATAFDVTYAPYMIDYCWYSEKDGSKNIGNSIRLAGGVSSAFNHAAITTNPAPNEAKYMRVDARLYSDGKIKVERGSIATDWTPAPEDVVVRSELEALIKRIVALEEKAGITSADSMELPSMDVMESGSETASADDAEDDTEIN